jgi:hypothetical protein
MTWPYSRVYVTWQRAISLRRILLFCGLRNLEKRFALFIMIQCVLEIHCTLELCLASLFVVKAILFSSVSLYVIATGRA